MKPRISRATWSVSVAGVAVIAVAYGLILIGVGGEDGTVMSSYLGGLAIDVLACVMVVRTALAFGPGEPLRRQWLAVAIGVALFTLGDAVSLTIEVVSGSEPPYPGVPDLFFVPVYAFLAFGMLNAALAYRRLVDLRVPLVGSALVTTALGSGLVGFVIPPLAANAASVGEATLSVFYPVADLLLLFAPALFILFVLKDLRGGALAWPWYPVAAGLAVLALADTGYSWLCAYDVYETGMIVDVGWMLGYLLIGVGAAIARDVMMSGRSVRRPAEDAEKVA